MWQHHGSECHYSVEQSTLQKVLFHCHIFFITRESEDEQRPVLVSAHPPQKIRKKYPAWKLEYLSPQTCGWQIKLICKKHLIKKIYKTFYLGKGVTGVKVKGGNNYVCLNTNQKLGLMQFCQ